LWFIHNKMSLNWSKTKFMILSGSKLPDFKTLNLFGMGVEVVSEFKLLGILIDNKFSFSNHIKQLKLKVNSKLFSLKKLFFLSFEVKLHFFKSFILPHFDYCSTIFIYMNNKSILSIEKFFNNCIYLLLKIDLFKLTIENQFAALNCYTLFPFRLRLFQRFSMLVFKIMNRNMLLTLFCKLNFKKNIRTLRSGSLLLLEPLLISSNKAKRRLDHFLISTVNSILKNSIYLSFSDFKIFINNNICNLSSKFFTLIN